MARAAVASRSGRRARRTTCRSPGALVLGGDYRGLGVVRSLGRRGIPVWVLHTGTDRLAATSRYASRRVRWPGSGRPDRAVELLMRLAEAGDLDRWLLIPTADETALLLAQHHAELSTRYVVSTPAWDVFRWAYDKRLTHQLADDVDVARPRTCVLRDRAAAEAVPLPFPLVLKPAVKPSQEVLRAKAWRADDRAELLRAFDAAARLVEPGALMAQELIPGDGASQLSFAALCHRGEVLAEVVARRTRQYPMDFGRASTMVETLRDEAVEGSARRLLSRLGLTGLVEAEFKRDERDGSLRLLDLNARVWGWHSLGARAGVDFPYLLWSLFRGEQLSVVRGRPGVRWVRMSTDAPTALRLVAGRELSPGAYLRSLRGPRAEAIFARDDPVPGLAEVPLLLQVAAGRWRSGRPL